MATTIVQVIAPQASIHCVNRWNFFSSSYPVAIPRRKFVLRAEASQSVSGQVEDSVSVDQRRKRSSRPQNVDGEFFVDHTCIDCDTCRWMAPEVFARVGSMSAVFKQPEGQEERLKALQALLACPTSSIHTKEPARDILEVHKTFPIPIDDQRIPGVYHCGYHSENSYGATSYFIIHPDGNILVDSPRYNERLATNIQNMGGVQYMFLTHKDDVADHEKWSKRFGCQRFIHSLDVNTYTSDVEIKLEGGGPWSLNHDIELIHVPGHSEGSVCLFHKKLKVLFTGDHLLVDESNQLSTADMYNHFSVSKQLENVRLLLKYDFEWILPGHGRRAIFRDVMEKNSVLEAFLKAKKFPLV